MPSTNKSKFKGLLNMTDSPGEYSVTNAKPSPKPNQDHPSPSSLLATSKELQLGM